MVVAAVGAVTLVPLVGTETVALTVGVDTVVLTAGVDTVVLTVGVDTIVVLTGVDTVVLIAGDGTEPDGKVVEPVTVGRPTARATAGNCPTIYPAIAIAPSATPRFMVALRTNRFAAVDSMLVPVDNRVPIRVSQKPEAPCKCKISKRRGTYRAVKLSVPSSCGRSLCTSLLVERTPRAAHPAGGCKRTRPRDRLPGNRNQRLLELASP
jgi:hypothetical protein